VVHDRPPRGRAKRLPDTGRPQNSPADHSFLLSAAALVLVIAGLFIQWRRGNSSVGIDFYQFWIGGQAVRQHRVDNLYSAYGREALAGDGQARAALPEAGQRLRFATRLRSRVETFSTPFLYSAFALFGPDYETSYQIYRALSLMAMCISILLLGRTAGLHLRWSLLLLAFVLFLYQPLDSEVRVANVNAIQLLMLAAGISMLSIGDAPRLDVASGALFAITAAFKPNLLLIVPLLLIGKWLTGDRGSARRIAAGALLGAGSAMVVSGLVFGSWRCWAQWRIAVIKLATTILPRSAGNVAPLLSLIQRSGPLVSAVSAALLTALAIGALALGRRRGIDEHRKEQLVVGVGALIYLMTAGLVWLHYILLALPSAIALLGKGRFRVMSATRGLTHVAAVRSATLLALSALAIDPWSIATRLSRAAVAPIAVTSGLMILFLLSLGELARGARMEQR